MGARGRGRRRLSLDIRRGFAFAGGFPIISLPGLFYFFRFYGIINYYSTKVGLGYGGKGKPGGEDLVAGRNAVAEALRAGRPLDSVLIARGERSGSLVALAAKCRERGIPVKEVDSRKLDALCGPNHQGIAAVAACREYATLDDLFDLARERGSPPSW